MYSWLYCKSNMAEAQHSRATVAWPLQIGLSRSTECANMDSFPWPSLGLSNSENNAITIHTQTDRQTDRQTYI